jgi:bifunctional non-homologous end joining protein LigD
LVAATNSKAGSVAAEPKSRRTRSSARSITELITRYQEVQLATLVDVVPTGANWVQEIKFDGYRLLGFRSSQEVRLITRNGKDWTGNFPSLSMALSELAADNAVLDMEAVVLDAGGKSSFQALQNALGAGGNRESIVAYVFDLLYLNGKDLTKLTLLERKEKLEALLGKSKTLRYSGHVTGQGEEMLAKACDAGLEGIVSKDVNSPYAPDRGRSWLKIKCSLRQEFIIVGYSEARKGERALGALYLGYRNNGVLQYAGKVGTGFTMNSARELIDRLTKIHAAAPVLSSERTTGLAAGEWRAVHWVKPVVRCEVAFTEWTSDGRVRHPSFQGLREDKNTSEVRMETAPTEKAAATEGRQARHVILHGITITHPDRIISDTGHITPNRFVCMKSREAQANRRGINCVDKK